MLILIKFHHRAKICKHLHTRAHRALDKMGQDSDGHPRPLASGEISALDKFEEIARKALALLGVTTSEIDHEDDLKIYELNEDANMKTAEDAVAEESVEETSGDEMPDPRNEGQSEEKIMATCKLRRFGFHKFYFI